MDYSTTDLRVVPVPQGKDVLSEVLPCWARFDLRYLHRIHWPATG
jgi:hypothetical protein